MRFKPPILVVHGGAGSFRAGWNEERKKAYINGLKEAVLVGFEALKSGGAIEAVVEAVKCMEDNPIFNAGKGSALNLRGEVELDAGIMDGKSLSVGGVGAVKNVKNPIVLARKVMELTDHNLLVGVEAEAFAKMLGLEFSKDLVTTDSLRRFNNALKSVREGKGLARYFPKLRKLLLKHPELVSSGFGTVGAVALDSNGNVAAATSTGGVWLKVPGRVGDTPIVGAGFYADNRGGAASATGIGEYIMVLGISRKAVELMMLGVHAETAAKAVIDMVSESFGEDTAGIITVDVRGCVGVAFNTKAMGRAILASNLREPIVGMDRP